MKQKPSHNQKQAASDRLWAEQKQPAEKMEADKKIIHEADPQTNCFSCVAM